MKNLVFVGRVLCHMPDRRLLEMTGGAEQENGASVSQEVGKETLQWASLTWLIKRMSREAKMETANNAKSTVKVSYLQTLYYGSMDKPLSNSTVCRELRIY